MIEVTILIFGFSFKHSAPHFVCSVSIALMHADDRKPKRVRINTELNYIAGHYDIVLRQSVGAKHASSIWECVWTAARKAETKENNVNVCR